MKFTKEKLDEVLENHKNWLENNSTGNRANLCDADLRYAYLRGADLRNADLCDADLRYAYLRGADLRNADLRDADLRDADLCYADLRGADLRDADLRYADLRDADLRYADLRGADLRGADLCYVELCSAKLSNATLEHVSFNECTSFFSMTCPEEGSYIGWKKANKYIIKLRITENANRSSATTRKCRASEAEVLEIQNLDGTKADILEVASNYNKSFVYRVGEIVKVDDFDDNRWNECSTGIHHFITRQEAVKY